MKISIGAIFSILLLWTAIFSFIAIIYKSMLLKAVPTPVELVQLEDAEKLLNKTLIPSKDASINIVESVSSDSNAHEYAYVTLLHGIDDTFSYRGFLYNCLIVKRALEALHSNSDFIVLVGFTYGINPNHPKINSDIELMIKFGIKLHYLPELNIRASSAKRKIPFSEMALLKITPWSFIQYKKVQFFDGDVLPHKNMDCLFQLEMNTFNTGSASPLNSGWFLAIPNVNDYEKLKELAVKRLNSRWDEAIGWGKPMPPQQDALYYRGTNKVVKSWNYNGASLDQGLLTHYYVLGEGRVQLIDVNHVTVYQPFYQHNGKLSVNKALQCCSSGDGDVTTLIPTQMFYHYTGRNKPWLQDLNQPKDISQQIWAKYLDELRISINSTNINQKSLKSPLGYFYPNK